MPPNDGAGGEEAATQNEDGKDTGNIDQALSNLKTEFSRKVGNISEALTKQNEQIAAMLEAQQQQQVVVPPTTQDDTGIGDLLYADPDKAVETIVEKVASKVTQRVDSKQAQQQAAQAAVVKIQSQYPELADQASDAYKLAEKYYDKLPAALVGTAEGAELALMRAASEQGLVAMSKRSRGDESDDFTLDGEGARRRSSGKRGKQDDAVDPKTLGFAQLMGKNTKDPKYIASLKDANKRQDWGSWASAEGDDSE